MKWLILLFLLISNVINADYKQLKIAIVDTGLNLQDERFKGHICPEGHKSFAGTIADRHGHGTHIAGLIQKYAGDGDYCFLIYKYYSSSLTGNANLHNEIKAFKEAAKNGANIINFSGGGAEFNEEERSVILDNPDILFVVAAGNNGKNIDISQNMFYPASYDLPNEIIVGNVGKYGNRAITSNWGSTVRYWETGDNINSYIPCTFLMTGEYTCSIQMGGTSQSTAIRTGKIINDLLHHRTIKRALNASIRK